MNTNLVLNRRTSSVIAVGSTTSLSPLTPAISQTNDINSGIKYKGVQLHDSETVSTSIDKNSVYTIDEAISHIGSGWFQYRLLFLTGIIMAADAMEMMLLSFLLPKLKKQWDLSPPWDGTIGAIVFVGSLLGTTFWSVMADKYGRRKVVIYSTLGCALFGTLSAFAGSLTLMLAARFFVGFTVGGSGTAYTLFAEYCPKEQRGKLLVVEQSFWAFGALFSVCLAWFCLGSDYFDEDTDWRYYLFLSSIPLWIIGSFGNIVPESTRWYLACNNTQQAQKMLSILAKVNNKSLPKGKLQSNNNVNQRGRIADIFCVKQYRNTSVLLYITFWCLVFGYYGISFISERYFELFTIDGEDNVYWNMAISTSSEIPSLFLGLFMLDKAGRKNTMIFNFGIFFAFCFSLIIISSDLFGVIAVFLSRMSISLSFMATCIYFSEYYPTVIRSTALGFASSLGRVAGIVTSFVSQDLSIKTGMSLYGLSGFIAFVCCILLPLDTMGRDLPTSVQSGIIEMNKIKVFYEESDDTDSDID